jgi:hypothetical protein
MTSCRPGSRPTAQKFPSSTYVRQEAGNGGLGLMVRTAKGPLCDPWQCRRLHLERSAGYHDHQVITAHCQLATSAGSNLPIGDGRFDPKHRRLTVGYSSFIVQFQQRAGATVCMPGRPTPTAGSLPAAQIRLWRRGLLRRLNQSTIASISVDLSKTASAPKVSQRERMSEVA